MKNSNSKMNGYVSQKDKDNRNNNNNSAGRKEPRTPGSQRDVRNGVIRSVSNSAGHKGAETADGHRDFQNGSGSINGSQKDLRLHSSEGNEDKYKGKFTGKSTLKNPFG